MRTICASTVSLPTRSARITSVPVPLTVAPVTRAPRCLLHRQRLAGEHRLVDRAVIVRHHSVDGNLLSRAHPQPLADLHLLERNVLFSVAVQTMRQLGRQPQQRANRARGLAARAQLQHLPEQHQRGDHRRRLEIDRRHTAVHAKRRRQRARRQQREDAEQVGDAGAERDQREHVQAPVDDGGPAAHEERPGAPQHHRRRQNRSCSQSESRMPIACCTG